MIQRQTVPPVTSTQRSCLYECRVMHHRRWPREHRFEYGIFLVCVDLDELDALGRELRWFSRNRRNIYEFRDADHLDHAGHAAAGDLKRSLLAWLETEGTTVPSDARVKLVTLPRVLGYVFNPVSFYFVESADGVPITAVAEVGNTFGELKPYQVPPSSGTARAGRFRRRVPKHYYVSPFSSVDLCFDFQLRVPAEHLSIAVNDVTTEGKTVLVSTLTGSRRPLTDRQLLRLTARYPWVTLRVIALIHWHALRLWLKRIPYFGKTDGIDRQIGVYRPHGSLRTPAAPVPSTIRPAAVPLVPPSA